MTPILKAAEIQALREKYPPNYKGLWEGILQLAAEVWTTSVPDRLRVWQHFLFAVGNFKRQTPIYPFPAAEASTVVTREHETVQRDETFKIGELVLERNDSESWKKLTQKRNDQAVGIAVPTATTVLAALWPEHHAIFDQRTLRASIGLKCFREELDYEFPVNREREKLHCTASERYKASWLTWPSYKWYLEKCVKPCQKGSLELVDIERALWTLDDLVESEDRTWRVFGELLAEKAKAADTRVVHGPAQTTAE